MLNMELMLIYDTQSALSVFAGSKELCQLTFLCFDIQIVGYIAMNKNLPNLHVSFSIETICQTRNAYVLSFQPRPCYVCPEHNLPKPTQK